MKLVPNSTGLAAVLLSGSCLMLASGCGQQSADAPAPTPARQEAKTERHAGGGLTLALDNGKKWQVDEHTRASAEAMTTLIADAAPIDSVEDAQALAAAFNEELQNLIQGCTMTGPAHDQLHVFLGALLPQVDALKQETDPEALRQTQQEIRTIFDAYADHFQ